MADLLQIAALKDFAPLFAALVTLGGTLGLGIPLHRREVRRLRAERDRGTGRDPATRVELYKQYVQSLDAFYSPEERTPTGFNRWSSAYSSASTEIDILGLESVRGPVKDLTKILDRLRRERLTGVDGAEFGTAWYRAVEANQLELDQARARVLRAMQVDVGASAVSGEAAGSS